ncbi:MAG TPA: hypothetical protein VNJ04_11095 [Gemmatimonadaceae bacterium]|nr:hypothetical protein [Gemmatimonadaceae bacterium]
MMYDLAHFALSDMTRCGRELRKLGADASSLEQVADRTVRFLHDSLRVSDGSRACGLVRFFLTMPYSDLEPEQQRFVRGLIGAEVAPPTMKCLTLMATVGEMPAWNSRRTSSGHGALPLASAESVARSPMIAQLISQLGVEVASLITPEKNFLVDAEQHSFNVFHVPEAKGSPYIPAQDEFVTPHGIRSVLGFGGLLPSGELFAAVLFSKCPIGRETADRFKPLALNAKVAILPFVGGKIFA